MTAHRAVLIVNVSEVEFAPEGAVPQAAADDGHLLGRAYQEALGDIHNVFGDTDTLSVRLNPDGSYELQRQRRGDTTEVMLDYVGYNLGELRARYRTAVLAAVPAERSGGRHVRRNSPRGLGVLRVSTRGCSHAATCRNRTASKRDL